MFSIKLLLAGIGPLIAHWSIGLIIIAACVAGELFIGAIVAYIPLLAPATKQIKVGLLVVAMVTAAVLFGEWLGASDATARCDAKAAVVVNQVHKQVGKAKTFQGTDKFQDDKL